MEYLDKEWYPHFSLANREWNTYTCYNHHIRRPSFTDPGLASRDKGPFLFAAAAAAASCVTFLFQKKNQWKS